MKFARYWIPIVLGFAFGTMLSWRVGGTPMRKLLAASNGAPSPDQSATGAGRMQSSAMPADDNRFGRLFSALQETRGLKRRSEIHNALGDLEADAFEGLMNRVEMMPGGMNTMDLANAILERWFELDAEAARRWIRSRPKVQSYWLLWAKVDPESALKEAIENGRIPWGGAMVFAATNALAKGSRTEKAKLILALPPGEIRQGSFLQLVSEWSLNDCAEGLQFVNGMPPGVLRTIALDNLLRSWSQHDVDGALKGVPDMLADLQGAGRAPNLIAYLAADLAKRDPKAGLEWVDALPEKYRTPGAYAKVVYQWAKKDPVAALDWCAANGIDVIAGSIVGSAMFESPAKTLEWIQAQPDEAARDTLLEHALMSGLRRATALTNAQNFEKMQNAVGTLSGEAQSRAAYGLSRTLVFNGGRDEPEFHAWLNQLQDPALRASVITGAGSAMGQRNDDTVMRFAEQFTVPAERDAALQGIAKGFQNNRSLGQAADAAITIQDPTVRWETIDNFMVDWLRKSPTAASRWLEGSSAIAPEWAKAWRKEAASGL